MDFFNNKLQTTGDVQGSNIIGNNICYSNGTGCASQGFTTDQNDQLNTTGSPTFDSLNVPNYLYSAGIGSGTVLGMSEHILYAGTTPAYMINFFTEGLVDFYDNSLKTTGQINATQFCWADGTCQSTASSGGAMNFANLTMLNKTNVPTSNALYDFGSSALKWLNGYFTNLFATNINTTILNTANLTFTEPSPPMTNSYNNYLVPLYNLTIKHVKLVMNDTSSVSNITSSDRLQANTIKVLYTVPTGRKVNLAVFAVINTGKNNMVWRPLIQVNNSYFPLTSPQTINGNSNSQQFFANLIADAGMNISFQCIAVTNCTNITAYYSFDEFDASSSIFTSWAVNLSLGNYGTLVTAGANEYLKPISIASATPYLASATSTLYYSTAGFGPNILGYYVWSGESPSIANKLSGNLTVIATMSAMSGSHITLLPGDSLQFINNSNANDTYLLAQTFTSHQQ
jgi:hypothetical protein